EFLEELLNESKESMEFFELEKVQSNYQIIKHQVNYALDSKNLLKKIGPLLDLSEKKGIDISKSRRLYLLTELSISRGDFSQAYQRAKDLQLTYAFETKGELGRLTYYIQEYPREISFS